MKWVQQLKPLKSFMKGQTCYDQNKSWDNRENACARCAYLHATRHKGKHELTMRWWMWYQPRDIILCVEINKT